MSLYRWRVGNHTAQELLAGSGIAIGVALLFGVLIANSSLIGSARQLAHAVNGNARLELVTRSPEGIDERTADRAEALPGVAVSAPLLRENATIVGPGGRREAIQLVGVTASQVFLKGEATKELGAGALLLSGGIGLPSVVGEHIGATADSKVTVLAGGRAGRVEVRVILGTQAVGPLAGSPLAVALLPLAQKLAGRQGHVTSVLIQPQQGKRGRVSRELRALAAGRAEVQAADYELPILTATAKPTSQSTVLFAAISAIVGFLLALNAMLLTVPERRRFAAELRQQGFGPRQVLLILVSHAMILGLGASAVGVVLGYVLSQSLFHDIPSYLSFAFPIGSRPVVPVAAVAIAMGAGVLATVAAALLPMRDLRSGRAPDAVLHEVGEAGQRIGKRTVVGFGAAGVALVILAAVFVLIGSSLSIFGGVVLAGAAFCLVLPIFVLALRLLKPISERVRGSMLALAVVELEATATRSVALAGVAAIAVYGMVAIQGARHDLLNGLDTAIVEYLDPADIWVTTDNNFLTIDSFRTEGAQGAISRAPGIASVREYQGQLLDLGTRRLWLRARPPSDRRLIQASQLLHGNLTQATRRIREGGWVAISNSFAAEQHARVGDTIVLPTPTGRTRLAVAANTTNVGWPPGALTMNLHDYRRYWQSSNPTALEINLKPGVTPSVGKQAVEHALGSRPGLQVQTFSERAASYKLSARQGIHSLSEIATLLLIAASLAIASALTAAIWQRRARLASLKCQGFDGKQLWRALLLESAILVCIGAIEGALLGVYGHALASRWLRHYVGFPAPFSLGIGLVIFTLAVVTLIAIAVISLPGLAASRVPPQASFQE